MLSKKIKKKQKKKNTSNAFFNLKIKTLKNCIGIT